MTYNPNIPQPTDLLSNSQGQILANFNKANSSFGTNHFAFDNGTVNNGKHSFIELPVTAPVNVAGEGTIYTNTGGGETQLFYLTDGQGKAYQLTNTINASYTLFSTNTAYASIPPNANTVSGGWTFLPGGMLLQYGLVNIQNAPGTTKVTFPVAFPSGTAPYSIQVTAIVSSSTSGDQTASVRTSTVNALSFQIACTSSGNVLQFYWMAVGK